MNSKLGLSRVLAEALGLCISALFGFAALLLIDLIFLRAGPDSYFWSLTRFPLLLAYVTGRVSAGEKWRALRLVRIAGVLLSFLLSFITYIPDSGQEYLAQALCLVPAILLCHIGTLCVPVYPQAFSLASVVLYLANIVIMGFSGWDVSPGAPVCVCALADFFLFLFSANLKSTLDGAHAPGSRAPSGLGLKSFLLLLGFALASFALAMTGLLQSLISFVLRTLLAVISAVIAFIRGLFKQRPLVYEAPEAEPTPAPLMEDVEPGAWRYLVYAFCLALLVFAVVMISLFIIRLIRSRDGRTRKKRVKIRGILFSKNEQEDEIESTLDGQGLFDRFRQGLADSLARLRREPGFADMKTDAERVRFAFRAFKRMRMAAGEPAGVECSTPLELAVSENSPVLRRLAEDYSALRYGDIEPGPDGGGNARGSMAEIKNKKGRKSR